MIRVDAALKLGAFDLDISFENDLGITALFGRSGSGKSMTINLIAGLARPDRGRIMLEDRALVDTENNVFVPKHRRRVGLVFQDAQLFPHFNVRQNLLFGRWFAPKREPAIAFDRVVDTLGIGHLLGRRPARLSGGEKQRVAIGRALLASPKILLMDEPLASLDTERKLEILPLVESLRDEFRIPIVYVSHAVEEVARLAARVVVLERGRVRALGTVEDVLGPGRPQPGESRFARASIVTGRISGVDTAYGLTEISHPAGTIWLAARTGPVGREVRVVIKATDVTLSTNRPRNLSIRTTLVGTVASIESDDGPLAAVHINLEGHGQLVALATRKGVDELGLGRGDQVFALVKAVALDERTVAAAQP
ncbi:molybdenum ABC transporter ATP-binding protein [Pseudolabrys sp. FHR47]|uniref:molybdenum ABC transporter ATP-binding protein n=1 Tax=Pseudolabrys sp. FHR47 TaxID=2562284 RepID=UPI0010BF47F1|nr:molybdenum ABC transporter ATP-binding protein [Pseudolabrys sp. FHR47]